VQQNSEFANRENCACFLGFAEFPGAISDWITGLDLLPELAFALVLLAYADQNYKIL
jgi:hypothetical protein